MDLLITTKNRIEYEKKEILKHERDIKKIESDLKDDIEACSHYNNMYNRLLQEYTRADGQNDAHFLERIDQCSENLNLHKEEVSKKEKALDTIQNKLDRCLFLLNIWGQHLKKLKLSKKRIHIGGRSNNKINIHKVVSEKNLLQGLVNLANVGNTKRSRVNYFIHVVNTINSLNIALTSIREVRKNNREKVKSKTHNISIAATLRVFLPVFAQAEEEIISFFGFCHGVVTKILKLRLFRSFHKQIEMQMERKDKTITFSEFLEIMKTFQIEKEPKIRLFDLRLLSASMLIVRKWTKNLSPYMEDLLATIQTITADEIDIIKWSFINIDNFRESIYEIMRIGEDVQKIIVLVEKLVDTKVKIRGKNRQRHRIASLESEISQLYKHGRKINSKSNANANANANAKLKKFEKPEKICSLKSDCKTSPEICKKRIEERLIQIDKFEKKNLLKLDHVVLARARAEFESAKITVPTFLSSLFKNLKVVQNPKPVPIIEDTIFSESVPVTYQIFLHKISNKKNCYCSPIALMDFLKIGLNRSNYEKMLVFMNVKNECEIEIKCPMKGCENHKINLQRLSIPKRLEEEVLKFYGMDFPTWKKSLVEYRSMLKKAMEYLRDRITVIQKNKSVTPIHVRDAATLKECPYCPEFAPKLFNFRRQQREQKGILVPLMCQRTGVIKYTCCNCMTKKCFHCAGFFDIRKEYIEISKYPIYSHNRYSCKEFEELCELGFDGLSEKIMKDYKRCPNNNCGAAIHRTDGCNHIVCKCGTHFCYVCRFIGTRDQVYAHMREVCGTYPQNNN